MSKDQSTYNDYIKETITNIIRKRQPQTVEELIDFVRKDLRVPDQTIIEIIQELEDEKRVEFNELIFPEKPADFLFSLKATWYWTVLLISAMALITFFIVPDDMVPFSYLRNILGSVFVLYLPGYSLIKLFYPVSVPLKTISITLDGIERIALSSGLSLIVTPLVGLAFYFSFFGLDLTLIAFGLFCLIVIFASAALFREYYVRKTFFFRRQRKTLAYFTS